MKTRIEYHESLAGKKPKLKKGDKLLTATGDIETFERFNSNGNVETKESIYSWGPHNLKKIED
jgi:hypothetical protein